MLAVVDIRGITLHRKDFSLCLSETKQQNKAKIEEQFEIALGVRWWKRSKGPGRQPWAKTLGVAQVDIV